jgi:hypothetical protein
LVVDVNPETRGGVDVAVGDEAPSPFAIVKLGHTPTGPESGAAEGVGAFSTRQGSASGGGGDCHSSTRPTAHDTFWWRAAIGLEAQ